LESRSISDGCSEDGASEVVSEALHLWRGSHPERNHDSVHFYHQSNAEVLVDAMRMHQVIVNLLDNALQHGGNDTEVVLSVVDTENDCRISVSDSGRGIDAADVDRVFEPFFTTRASVESAKTAVEISLGLVGIMTLWLGVMRVAEQAGLVSIVKGRPLLC
jgi:signal transduction histidine kinase